MRNWHIYIQSDGESDELLAEWEEVCLKDFLQHGKEWLNENKNSVIWRFGLE